MRHYYMLAFLDALAGHLSTTLLHTAGIDECAAVAAADLDELVAAAGRLKQSNGPLECSISTAAL